MTKLNVAALSTLVVGAVLAAPALACPDMAQAKDKLSPLASAQPAPQHSVPGHGVEAAQPAVVVRKRTEQRSKLRKTDEAAPQAAEPSVVARVGAEAPKKRPG